MKCDNRKQKNEKHTETEKYWSLMGKDHFSMTQSSKNHDTAETDGKSTSIFIQAFAFHIQYPVLKLL